MNFYLWYDRIEGYYLETYDWHERFANAASVFIWLSNHMGPGDILHWVENE